MFTHFSFFVVLLCAILTSETAEAGTKSSVSRCKQHFRLAENLIERELSKQLDLAAGFIRASFHDCFTVTDEKKDSGCNGSLRLREELAGPKNNGLDKVMKFLEPILRASCISTADAIQIGVEKALLLTGGMHVSLGRGRTDAATSDMVDELPGLFKFKKLKEIYAKKKFTVPEMVASIVGGHAVGRFFGVRFTSNPKKFNNMYAVNLVHFLQHGKDLKGFNSLSSDRGLLSDQEALLWVKFYADRSGAGPETKGTLRLKKDFMSYLSKQSKM